MKKLLQLLGLRTDCCNARMVTWHYDRHYCANCERWLEQPKLDHNVKRTKVKLKTRLS